MTESRAAYGPVWLLSILVNLPFAALEIFAPKPPGISTMLNDPTVISYTCIFLPLTGIALFPLGRLFGLPKRLPGHYGKNGTADDFRCC